MATYGDLDTIRAMTGITDTDIDDDNLHLIMQLADDDLDEYMGNIRWKWERFAENHKEDRFFVMKEEISISSFDRVMINGVELFEYDKNNTLNNPDVSEGDSTNAYPDYWEKGSETSATLTWDTTYAKTGARSLSILKTVESTAYWNSEVLCILEDKPYRITGWVKTDSVTAGTGNGAFIRLTWKSSNETVISSIDGDYITGTNDWTEYSITGTAPVGAVYAEIRLVHDGNAGTAYFDRFFFSKRNWTGDATNYTIEFTENLAAKEVLVRYTRTNVPNYVRSLANKLSARNALINVVGGATTGMSYRFADQMVNMNAVTRHRMSLIEMFTKEFKDGLSNIDAKYDADFDDFGIVEI